MGEQYEPLLRKIGITRDVLNYWIKSSDQSWMLDNDNNTTRSTIGSSKNSVPIHEIINNRELEGLVSEAITYNRPANVQSRALVKRINEIIELIESEIDD